MRIMNLRKLILSRIKKNRQTTSKEIMNLTGFSRVYINRFLKQLINEKKIVLVGKANQARYVLYGKVAQKRKNISRLLKNQKLSEDRVLEEIKNQTLIFEDTSTNLNNILSYGFTEIMNNAIEHSRSKTIQIKFSKNKSIASFTIRDFGVGVFKNILKKFQLKNEVEAINHLLKGKQTTLPKAHSGEGIFFTSKVADLFSLESHNKKLIVNNTEKDIFIKNIKTLKGTRAIFTINIQSQTTLRKIFSKYAGKSFQFSKTKILVKLGLVDNVFLSRSQARRIIFGLDKFKKIILDFKGVESIGKSFADEIFRVWQNNHPKIAIKHQNANDNSLIMITRAKSK